MSLLTELGMMGVGRSTNIPRLRRWFGAQTVLDCGSPASLGWGVTRQSRAPFVSSGQRISQRAQSIP